MLITQFRKFQPINFVFLFVFGFLLCMITFFQQAQNLELRFVEPLIVDLILGSTWDYPIIISQVSVIIALLLTVFQSVALNRISNFYKLFSKPSFLVAFMYLTLASAIFPFLVLSPVLMSNFIQIWLIYKLLKIYHLERAILETFDLGMLVALGSLVYFPFLIMFFAIWIALAVFRTFNWREWVAPVLGFGTFYFLVWVISFWFDRTDIFQQIWKPITSMDFGVYSLDKNDYIILIPVVFILLMFVNTIKNTIHTRIVYVRKAIQLMLYILLLSIVSILLERQHSASHFVMCVPVLSVYFAYYFNYAEKKWVYESLFGIFLLTILYLQIV